MCSVLRPARPAQLRQRDPSRPPLLTRPFSVVRLKVSALPYGGELTKQDKHVAYGMEDGHVIYHGLAWTSVCLAGSRQRVLRFEFPASETRDAASQESFPRGNGEKEVRGQRREKLPEVRGNTTGGPGGVVSGVLGERGLDAVLVPCDHWFHWGCVFDRDLRRCPVCRVEVTATERSVVF